MIWGVIGFMNFAAAPDCADLAASSAVALCDRGMRPAPATLPVHFAPGRSAPALDLEGFIYASTDHSRASPL